jgi:hypothetical protein
MGMTLSPWVIIFLVDVMKSVAMYWTRASPLLWLGLLITVHILVLLLMFLLSWIAHGSEDKSSAHPMILSAVIELVVLGTATAGECAKALTRVSYLNCYSNDKRLFLANKNFPEKEPSGILIWAFYHSLTVSVP